MQSAFGVEHSDEFGKADRRKTLTAGATIAGAGAGAAGGLHAQQGVTRRRVARQVQSSRQSVDDAMHARAGHEASFHAIVSGIKMDNAHQTLARGTSSPRRAAAAATGALVGAAAARGAVRRRAIRKEARSGFGIEHELAKGVRPDKMIEAAVATGRKGKLKPLATPLADAKLGPRVSKSAFGVVHKGPLAAADGVALAPGRVKAVTATVRPGQAIPSATKKPLTERLNGAIAATGGSPS